MRVELVILLVATGGLVSQSAVISASTQIEIQNYKVKIAILEEMLERDCNSFTRLSSLPSNLMLLKFRYQKMVEALSDCQQSKSKYNLASIKSDPKFDALSLKFYFFQIDSLQVRNLSKNQIQRIFLLLVLHALVKLVNWSTQHRCQSWWFNRLVKKSFYR